MSVLGLIPARSGSKGIPDKNIKQICGRPLIAWACEAALNARTLDKIVCSSDSAKIIEITEANGVKAPFIRPSYLAQDNTLIVDVICHALEWLKDGGENYDYICLIQATSPLVQPEDIDRAVQIALTHNADTVICGYNSGQRHPTAMFTMGNAGEVEWLLDSNKRMARRQDLPNIFMRSGLVYVFRSDMLLKTKQLYGSKVYAVEVPEERAISIDTELDFTIVEVLLHRLLIQKEKISDD